MLSNTLGTWVKACWEYIVTTLGRNKITKSNNGEAILYWLSKIIIPNCFHHLFWPMLMVGTLLKRIMRRAIFLQHGSNFLLFFTLYSNVCATCLYWTKFILDFWQFVPNLQLTNWII
jgi:hypothetical protein